MSENPIADAIARLRWYLTDGSHHMRPEDREALALLLDSERERGERAEAKVRELHRALSNGHGVEDGGVWEDRAEHAEAELARLREALARADELASRVDDFFDDDVEEPHVMQEAAAAYRKARALPTDTEGDDDA